MKFLRFKNKNLKLRKGFTLVELLVAVAMLGILSAAAYIGISRVGQFMNNSRVEADLLAIENALERYYDDNDDQYPVPEVGEDKNLLCFNADTSYKHDCENAAFIQGMVDNKLMTKRYLQEVPTDPRTGSRYVYSVSQNGRHFQVAGIVYRSGEYRALVRGTLDRGGFPLASMIRAYDGSDFVMDEGTLLPYSPDHLVISATLDEVEGRVKVCEDTEAENCQLASADTVTDGDMIYAGDTLVSDNKGSAILYFSDGSVAYLYPDSTLAFQNSSDVEENDEDGIITKIRLKLLRGEIWNKVVRLSAASEYNIETTSAIAGVRGTEFGVDGNTEEVTLISGEIRIGDADNISNIKTASDDDSHLLKADAGKTVVADLNPSGPINKRSTSFDENIIPAKLRTKKLTPNIIPYITEAVSDASAQNYTVYFAFNGFENEAGDYGSVSGVELFSSEQQAGYKKLVPGALENPAKTINTVYYDDNKQNYKFTLETAEMNSLDTINMRAFYEEDADASRSYSGVSSPGVGFIGNPEPNTTYDFKQRLVYQDLPMSAFRPGITSPVCGNGQVEANEQCDDGNTIDGDGCSASCQTETPSGTLQDRCVANLSNLVQNASYSNGECWILADAGKSCTQACQSLSSPQIPVICDTGNWNDDSSCSKCEELVNDSNSNCDVSSELFGPYHQQITLGAGVLSICRYRDSDADCSPNSTSDLQRICKCV
jgi:prepilin-type N-terminal cleavage/methylation domain-containing protein